jgi:hypothetical protein
VGQELPSDLPADRRGALIPLVTRLQVTRLLVAQAAAAGAIGPFFRLGHPGLGRPRLSAAGLGHPGLGDPGPPDRELG